MTRSVSTALMPQKPLLSAPSGLDDQFVKFDASHHLRPVVRKDDYDSLRSWDFGWLVLKGINVAQGDENEIELAKRFSAGQKALYFFWYLDGQVTNGGFMQFFLNGYQRYVPTIHKGLDLIGDTAAVRLLQAAHDDCWKHRDDFEQVASGEQDWSWLRGRLPEMDALDEAYFEHHEQTMDLMENYIRMHPDEFVIVK
jgi:hypothetical protein